MDPSVSVPAQEHIRGGLRSIYEILKPVNMSEIVLFILFMTAIYVIFALIFYNQIQLEINTKSQCYLAKQSINSSGNFIATAQNENGKPLYTVNYNMPAKGFSVDCACDSGTVVNTFPNIDVYNLQTQQTMRLSEKICSCDKQYYLPGYNTIYYSGYPGVTRFMNTAALVGNASDVKIQADTSFFEAALNPKQYYNTY